VVNVLNWIVDRIVGDRQDAKYTLSKIDNPVEYSRSIFEQISVEHKHVENRFQWNLGLQGFLFASYAIAISESMEITAATAFADIVSRVGMTASAITLLGIVVAYSALNRKKVIWLSNKEALKSVATEPFSGRWTSLLGRVPSVGITVTIMVAWFFLDRLF